MIDRQFIEDTLVIATHNTGKMEEFKALFANFNFTVLSAAMLDIPEPEETETSFVGNAVLKAKEFYKSEGALQLIGLELRLGYSFDSSVWYYLISLAKASDITERGVESDKIYRVVVLTSGEVLPPYTPK